MDIKIYKIAKCYYEILKQEVKLFNLNGRKNFEQFCDELGGHNYDGELFDINYGLITATITYRNGVCKLCKDIEIYNIDGMCITENYNMED